MADKKKRETFLDARELEARTLKRFQECNPGQSKGKYWKDYTMTELKALAKTDEYIFKELRNARSVEYNRMRVELRKKKANFWDNMSAGNLKKCLNADGMNIHNGRVYFTRNGEDVLKFWIENRVLPRLEKELGLTGIKVAKYVGGQCGNLFNFDNAKIKEDENESEDNTNIS